MMKGCALFAMKRQIQWSITQRRSLLPVWINTGGYQQQGTGFWWRRQQIQVQWQGTTEQ